MVPLEELASVEQGVCRGAEIETMPGCNRNEAALSPQYPVAHLQRGTVERVKWVTTRKMPRTRQTMQQVFHTSGESENRHLCKGCWGHGVFWNRRESLRARSSGQREVEQRGDSWLIGSFESGEESS